MGHADTLTGEWISDTQFLEGTARSLFSPQTYSIDLYHMEPEAGKAAVVISGPGLAQNASVKIAERITFACEVMDLEGLDATGAPSVIYMPRHSVYGRVAVTTSTAFFGESYDGTIERDSTNLNIAYMKLFIDPKGPKIVLRR